MQAHIGMQAHIMKLDDPALGYAPDKMTGCGGSALLPTEKTEFVARSAHAKIDTKSFDLLGQVAEVKLAQRQTYGHKMIIDELCSLNWSGLTAVELTGVAWAYYFFSIQFRENLVIACRLYPADPLLRQLAQEECCTDNLSPWPGVAEPGERLDHDEFMKRLLELSPPRRDVKRAAEQAGRTYLSRVRAMDAVTRASSIGTYEDGGLERLFRSMLECKHWDTDLLRAFRHFLVRHIEFDNSQDQGHGALARHLQPTEGVYLIWREFRQLLTDAVSGLRTAQSSLGGHRCSAYECGP
jgi:hypothetical protein